MLNVETLAVQDLVHPQKELNTVLSSTEFQNHARKDRNVFKFYKNKNVKIFCMSDVPASSICDQSVPHLYCTVYGRISVLGCE